MKHFDSIIFDLDGTLWDTSETCAKAWNNALLELGITDRQVTAEGIRSVTGMPFDVCVKTLFSDLDTALVGELEDRIDTLERLHLTAAGGLIFDGVLEGIKRLAEHYELSIISNCQSWYLQLFLERSGLRAYFAESTCHGDSRIAKSEMIADLCRTRALSNPIYIGDTMGDQIASLKAGVSFGHARYGFGNSDASTAAFNTFSELLEYFLHRNSDQRGQSNLIDQITLTPLILSSHEETVFDIYRTYLYPYIKEAFGWNTEFQKARFIKSYSHADFSWIDCAGETCGVLCSKESVAELHIHLLIIFEKYQGVGLGRAVMEMLRKNAVNNAKPIRLSSFKVNRQAVTFYRSIGYAELSQDEHFYDFELDSIAQRSKGSE